MGLRPSFSRASTPVRRRGSSSWAPWRATWKQREADRARQSHFAEANAVFDGLGTGVFKTTPEGRFIFANRGLSDSSCDKARAAK